MYFLKYHPPIGELTDRELEDVPGGGCYTGTGFLKTTLCYKCEYFREDNVNPTLGFKGTCACCFYWEAFPGTCLHPKNKK